MTEVLLRGDSIGCRPADAGWLKVRGISDAFEGSLVPPAAQLFDINEGRGRTLWVA